MLLGRPLADLAFHRGEVAVAVLSAHLNVATVRAGIGMGLLRRGVQIVFGKSIRKRGIERVFLDGHRRACQPFLCIFTLS